MFVPTDMDRALGITSHPKPTLDLDDFWAFVRAQGFIPGQTADHVDCEEVWLVNANHPLVVDALSKIDGVTRAKYDELHALEAAAEGSTGAKADEYRHQRQALHAVIERRLAYCRAYLYTDGAFCIAKGESDSFCANPGQCHFNSQARVIVAKPKAPLQSSFLAARNSTKCKPVRVSSDDIRLLADCVDCSVADQTCPLRNRVRLGHLAGPAASVSLLQNTMDTLRDSVKCVQEAIHEGGLDIRPDLDLIETSVEMIDLVLANPIKLGKRVSHDRLLELDLVSISETKHRTGKLNDLIHSYRQSYKHRARDVRKFKAITTTKPKIRAQHLNHLTSQALESDPVVDPALFTSMEGLATHLQQTRTEIALARRAGRPYPEPKRDLVRTILRIAPFARDIFFTRMLRDWVQEVSNDMTRRSRRVAKDRQAKIDEAIAKLKELVGDLEGDMKQVT
ncbi:hypothetical protein A1Q2_05719 [Trichosporon asahii var. asahii CBS 8904]|uniref:Uncharacterized protein n=1 Tax=Trichosporon asahii var. asahii (strain CBS 8904) TaxID=1220162 RepID=K1V7M2_TRIAC|nr:hypothetical protein A1Q2_05719 [Trichosporon asahii var. asahii CBS 8904]